MSIGDPAILDGLLVSEYRPLLRYARRLTSDDPDAADLVHTVVARVLAMRNALPLPDGIRAWLRTVLLRTFIDSRRRATREVSVDEAVLNQHLAPERRSPFAESLPFSLSRTIDETRAIISALPSHYREPYELYTFEHLSYERIAARLAVPAKTVATRLSRARARLRVLMTASTASRRPGRAARTPGGDHGRQ